MRWHEITIHTREEVAELIANVFHDLGAGGVAIEESGTLSKQRDTAYGQLYDTPLNDIPEGEAMIAAYFADPDDVAALIARAEEHVRFVRDELGYDVGPATFGEREVREEDWAHSWKQYYKPVRVSERMTIKPTWEAYEPQSEDEIVLELDPGMAFGTGTHPTTTLCLRALEQELRTGDDAIDVGCGSGVLAIAMAKLGACNVLALDLDPVAVESSQQNVRTNAVEAIVDVRKSDLLSILRGHKSEETEESDNRAEPVVQTKQSEHGGAAVVNHDAGSSSINIPVRIVAANILADVIVLFTDDVYEVLQPGGIYITSGIILNKKDEVEAALQKSGFVLERVEREQDWIAIIARKP